MLAAWKQFAVAGNKVVAQRELHEGKIYAMEHACPHLRPPLDRVKITEDGAIVCPWHHRAFDLESGDVKH